jgi:hypothetical protein
MVVGRRCDIPQRGDGVIVIRELVTELAHAAHCKRVRS